MIRKNIDALPGPAQQKLIDSDLCRDIIAEFPVIVDSSAAHHRPVRLQDKQIAHDILAHHHMVAYLSACKAQGNIFGKLHPDGGTVIGIYREPFVAGKFKYIQCGPAPVDENRLVIFQKTGCIPGDAFSAVTDPVIAGKLLMRILHGDSPAVCPGQQMFPVQSRQVPAHRHQGNPAQLRQFLCLHFSPLSHSLKNSGLTFFDAFSVIPHSLDSLCEASR